MMSVGSRVPDLHREAVLVYKLCRELNIRLSVEWVSRDDNSIADELSRVEDATDYMLDPKCFRYVMYKHLYAYLECHNNLYSLQFGFRQKCSTNHALISIAESIRCSVDNKELGCGIFIDLKKAFDTVNHSILLLKLHHYGVRGKAYEWFHSYLSNRKQFVCVNDHDSDSLPLTCGVPQGSALGPLLSLLHVYVNDLPYNTSSLLTFHLFADDTNIYYSCKNLDELESKLNHELKMVAEWMKSNRLALSILKTNFIIFHSKKLKPSKLINLKIDGVNIKQVFTVKYLHCRYYL